MKKLFLLLTLCLSFNVFAWDNEYEFENMTQVDDFDFREVVLDKEGWTILVFNKGYCSLSNSKNDCFPYEAKLNVMAPKIYARNNNIQIVHMDTDFTFTHQDYNLKVLPSVVFLLDGQIMTTIEAKRCYRVSQPNCDYRDLNWSMVMLQKTLDEIYKIPASMD